MTSDEILTVLTRKRRLHPELRAPLDWSGFRRILERERVALHLVPLPRPAQLVQFDGAWAVLLNRDLPRRRDLYYGAHELAHLWLHVDEAGIERWEVCYNMEDVLRHDEHEDDAEFMAMCMLHEVKLEA